MNNPSKTTVVSHRSATMAFVGPHRSLVTAEAFPTKVYDAGTPWTASSNDWAELGIAPAPADDPPEETILNIDDYRRFLELVEDDAEPNEALVKAANRRGCL